MRPISCISIVLMLCAGTSAARADNRYYIMMFASQRDNPKLPRFAHTFATFVHIGNTGGKERIEAHTISWLPQTLDVVPRLRPEPGKNFDLKATLTWAERDGQRVIAWGPFQIDKKLYELAREQVERLNKGGIAYRMVDGKLRSPEVMNCIHAVSDLDTTQAPLVTGIAFGDAASLAVLRHFERWLDRPEKTHEAITDYLRLREHRIDYAPFTPSASAVPKGER